MSEKEIKKIDEEKISGGVGTNNAINKTDLKKILDQATISKVCLTYGAPDLGIKRIPHIKKPVKILEPKQPVEPLIPENPVKPEDSEKLK